MKYRNNPSSKDGNSMTLRLISGCLATLIIGSLLGTADAGANRTRFDFDYRKTFKGSLAYSKPVAIERMTERWVGRVPPWHREVLENITFPGLSESLTGGIGPEVAGGAPTGGPGQEATAVSSLPVIHGTDEGVIILRSQETEDIELTDSAFGHSGQEFRGRPRAHEDG